MWTKDYLVRGFVKRQRRRPWASDQVHGVGDYAEEWQALYRVEGARRALKQAKKEAETYRRMVLRWSEAQTRAQVEAAQEAILAKTRAVERAALEVKWAAERKAAKARAEAAWQQRKQEYNDYARANVTDRTLWVAWAYAQGVRQKHIAFRLGHRNASTVSQEIRRYIEAFIPEALYRNRWRDDNIKGDRQELVAGRLKGTPEPPRPKGWRTTSLATARWWQARTNLGRPVDMGGPRDQWLEYRLGDGQN